MNENGTVTELEEALDSFDPATRKEALAQLAGSADATRVPVESDVNMHLHSFFSYNAEGYSPSHLAIRARQSGLFAAGLCDFDVLDGLDEFVAAADLLELKGCVSLESRVFVPEFADREINSPGEPGIAYHMGLGFTTTDLPADAADLDDDNDTAEPTPVDLGGADRVVGAEVEPGAYEVP